MSKQNTDSGQVIPVPETNMTPGATEGTPAPNMNADEANESAACENNTPVNDTTAKAADAVTKSSKKIVSLPIHDDFELSDTTLNTVEQQVKKAIPRLTRGVRYTAKRIHGKAVWKMMTTGEKIVTGIAMSRLVKTNRLPLIEAGSNASHAKVYELK